VDLACGVYKKWIKKGKVEMTVECISKDKAYLFKELILDSEIINGIWFLSLKQLIKFKKDYGRPKDLTDIKLIEDHLKKA